MYLKDPSTGEPSPTLTLVFIGVIGAFVKLFLAGFECCGIKFSDFTGADLGMVVTPFLALYGHKRHIASNANSKTEQKDE